MEHERSTLNLFKRFSVLHLFVAAMFCFGCNNRSSVGTETATSQRTNHTPAFELRIGSYEKKPNMIRHDLVNSGKHVYIGSEFAVTGTDLVDARIGADDTGKYCVSVFVDENADPTIRTITEANIGNAAIVLVDGSPWYAFPISAPFGHEFKISGITTEEEAEDVFLAIQIGIRN